MQDNILYLKGDIKIGRGSLDLLLYLWNVPCGTFCIMVGLFYCTQYILVLSRTGYTSIYLIFNNLLKTRYIIYYWNWNTGGFVKNYEK